jgi:hypothetical protein
MGERSIRFTVTDGVTRRAATWKCWTFIGKGKSDVYLGCRELGGELKASLHQSGNWHIGFTQKLFDENPEIIADKSAGRFIMKWPRPPQIIEGMTLAFKIITPFSAVDTPLDVPLSKDIISIPIPPDNCAVEIAILIMTSSNLVSSWPDNMGAYKIAESMVMDKGETVYVAHRLTTIPPPGTLQGTPRYFAGKSRDDLVRARSPKALIFGKAKDGCCFIVDCAVEIRNSPA